MSEKRHEDGRADDERGRQSDTTPAEAVGESGDEEAREQAEDAVSGRAGAAGPESAEKDGTSGSGRRTGSD